MPRTTESDWKLDREAQPSSLWVMRKVSMIPVKTWRWQRDHQRLFRLALGNTSWCLNEIKRKLKAKISPCTPKIPSPPSLWKGWRYSKRADRQQAFSIFILVKPSRRNPLFSTFAYTCHSCPIAEDDHTVTGLIASVTVIASVMEDVEGTCFCLGLEQPQSASYYRTTKSK